LQEIGLGEDVEEGSFSVLNWDGYPENAPRPQGPFILLEGDEYSAARRAANAMNTAMHRADPGLNGLEIHELQPIKFNGSPTSLTNKIFLTRKQHAQFTKFWNNLQRSIQKIN
jgi:hypothetical protein